MNMQRVSVEKIDGTADAHRPAAISPAQLPDLIRFLDIAAIMTALFGLQAVTPLMRGFETADTIFCIGYVSLAYLLIGSYAGLFSLKASLFPLRRADDIVIALMSSVMLVLSVVYCLQLTERMPPMDLVALGATAATLIVLARLAFTAVARALGRRGVIGVSMAVLGDGPQARAFLQRFSRTQPSFTRLAGVFEPVTEARAATLEGVPVMGGLPDLLAMARAQSIDAVVIAMPWSEDGNVSATIDAIKELPVDVYLSSDVLGYEIAFRPVTGKTSELPIFEVVQRPISGWNTMLKRLEDIILASLLLILVAPLMLLIALLVKLDSPGPVLFRQDRLGFNNQRFSIYKFRSMYHRPQQDSDVRQATRNDARVTRIGRLIRRTSLDELPQLLNVLEGSMSLIGPRPHAVTHNESYGAKIRGYFARHRVKPGITGWAQVNGLRGETTTLAQMEDRIRYDIYYTENWSLLFDLRILFATVFIVLFQKTAY